MHRVGCECILEIKKKEMEMGKLFFIFFSIFANRFRLLNGLQVLQRRLHLFLKQVRPFSLAAQFICKNV